MVAASQGINSFAGAVEVDMGVLTTPQLHWMVRARNKGINATEQNYFYQLSSSFRCLIDLIPKGSVVNKENNKLIVDGANGVGGEKLEVLKKILDMSDMEIRNTGKEGVLNGRVGADYVRRKKVAPLAFGTADAGTRCASLDEDADRLVYFSVLSNASNKIDLVDGDKILSLFALFVKEQIDILNKKEVDKVKFCQATLGVVQTGYAHGASTDFLKQLGLEVVFIRTGVKYLHEKAAEYDIGIYFEPNGHGTICFSEDFLLWLESRSCEIALTSEGYERQKAARRLLAVSKLMNQAMGDALGGLLLVEAILQHLGWSIQRWSELYHDLPCRKLKVLEHPLLRDADKDALFYRETDPDPDYGRVILYPDPESFGRRRWCFALYPDRGCVPLVVDRGSSYPFVQLMLNGCEGNDRDNIEDPSTGYRLFQLSYGENNPGRFIKWHDDMFEYHSTIGVAVRGGWVMLRLADSSEIFLVNVITRQTVELPPLTHDMPMMSYGAFSGVEANLLYRQIVSRKSEPSPSNRMVALAYKHSDRLSIVQLRYDAERGFHWSLYELPHNHEVLEEAVDGILFFRDKLFVLVDRDIVCFYAGNFPWVVRNCQQLVGSVCATFVTHSGDLFLVVLCPEKKVTIFVMDLPADGIPNAPAATLRHVRLINAVVYTSIPFGGRGFSGRALTMDSNNQVRLLDVPRELNGTIYMASSSKLGEDNEVVKFYPSGRWEVVKKCANSEGCVHDICWLVCFFGKLR